MSKVTDLNIRGKMVEVRVDDNGRFFATVGSEADTVFEYTLEGLREKLLKESRTKSAKVAVRFCTVVGSGSAKHILRGVATGIHARTGQVMVRWQGKQGVDQTYLGGLHLRDLTEKEEAELTELLARQRKIDDEVNEWRGLRSIDVRKTVDMCVKEALAKSEATEKEGSK